MPPPPPPPPPGPGPPPPAPSLGSGSKGGGAPNRSALLDQIHLGAKLKKTTTNDRSAPQLGVVKNSGGIPGSGGGARPAGVGGLFAAGIPQLKPAGQPRVPGGAGGPALKPPGLAFNGATNVINSEASTSALNKPTSTKTGPPAPPPSHSKPNNESPSLPAIPGTNKSPVNIFGRPETPPSHSKPSNGSLPGPKGGPPGRPYPDPSKNLSKLSTNEEEGSSNISQSDYPSDSSANSPKAMPPPVSPTFPPPPSPLISASNPCEPVNLLARPLPPPPGDIGDADVSLRPLPRPPPSKIIPSPQSANKVVILPPPSRMCPPPPSERRAVTPPPPSRILPPPMPPNRTVTPPLNISAAGRGDIPPPPPSRADIPPPPPQRTTSNVPAGGTIGRAGPPNMKLAPQLGSGLPLPPQTQPPPVSQISDIHCSPDGDFEARFHFHQPHELAQPEPFRNINKIYPSQRMAGHQHHSHLKGTEK